MAYLEQLERHSKDYASAPEPADFIQRLASQTQVLACLRWLGEFQVLVCIPLNGTILAKDAADLADVPEQMLCRVVRLMAAFGFLREPEPGHVCHTPLSAPFVTNPSYLDAAMFLAETAAPAALNMSTATQRNAQQMNDSADTAYTTAFNTTQPFELACLERNRLSRQWNAYRRCTGDVDDDFIQLLGRLDWQSLGQTTVVDVCAEATAAVVTLAEIHPTLRFVIQTNDTHSDEDLGIPDELKRRVTVQQRASGAAQSVNDAAMYILRLTSPARFLQARVLAELHAHIHVLRANTGSTLILAPRLLPEPGAVEQDVEAMARLQAFSRLQLTNEGEMELSELIELVNSVSDSAGRLVVTNQLRSCSSATVALGVKYQYWEDGVAAPAIMY